MPERKLTAEEKAAADAVAETAQDEQAPAARTTTGGKVRLAPPPFTDEFRVGDTVLTTEGVEVDSATADKLREAAKLSGLKLREL